MSEQWRPGNPISRVARATARELAADHGPELAAQVEAALYARRTDQRPTQFVDPISLGSLVVSTAALSWTVYKDLRARSAKPTPDILAVEVSVQLPLDHLPKAEQQRIIQVVTRETVRDQETEH